MTLIEAGVRISMDRHGKNLDNVFYRTAVALTVTGLSGAAQVSTV